MGQIVNPGNAAFQRKALNGKIYVDKTGLLNITNEVIDTPDNLICNSRPRRFGKTVTANMLSAYYCRTCDSENLFHGLEISQNPDFKKYLNQYDVIYWDMQWCIDLANGPENLLSYLTTTTIQELKEYYPDIKSSTVTGALSDIYQSTGRGFVVIIDEWDVLVRDYTTHTQLVDSYINFLRGMFKGSGPDTYIHLAYMTGILPIKRAKTQSSLNNFKERTMLDPGVLAPYIGFTENEVQTLCKKYQRDFQQVKRWYDGYLLDGYHVYNPVAVVSVLTERSGFKSYWSATGSYEAVDSAITIDFDGLKTSIINMLAGEYVDVDITRFSNDPAKFKSKDDVITYLIHLGYLGYNGKAFVPNEEIRQELSNAVSETKWAEYLDLLKESKSLLTATLNGDVAKVAKVFDKVHSDVTSVIQYNDENSLSSVVYLAYLGITQYYYKPERERPTGKGFADLIYFPKPEYKHDYPVLLIELKWNKDAQTAITQIHDRHYPDSLKDYTDDILLVGINYNKDTKEHECIIEKYKEKEESEHITDSQRTQILTFHDIGVSDDNIARGLSLPIKAVRAVLDKKK